MFNLLVVDTMHLLDWNVIFSFFRPGFLFGLGLGLFIWLCSYGIGLLISFFKRLF